MIAYHKEQTAMPCYQSNSLPSGSTDTCPTSYATEADCLNACKEGACCTGTTCTVKPQCQCQGTGQTFKGVGTTCTTSPCNCPDSFAALPPQITVTVSDARSDYGGGFPGVNGTYTLTKGSYLQGYTYQLGFTQDYHQQYRQPSSGGLSVEVDILCLKDTLQYRYAALVELREPDGRRSAVWGVGNARASGCYADSFAGLRGNVVADVSCTFAVTCNPLP